MLKTVQDWLYDSRGLSKFKAIEGGTERITEDEILSIAENCEWVEIEDHLVLPRLSHKKTLVLGKGDLIEYCRSCGKSQNSVAYFISATGV